MTHDALADLGKYAGWLDRDYTSRQVRTAVAAVNTAVAAGDDLGSVLDALESAIRRVPARSLRRLFEPAIAELRRGL